MNQATMSKKSLSGEAILEPDLPIVDPHHHLWDRADSFLPTTPRRPHGFDHVIHRVPRYLRDELRAHIAAAGGRCQKQPVPLIL